MFKKFFKEYLPICILIGIFSLHRSEKANIPKALYEGELLTGKGLNQEVGL